MKMTTINFDDLYKKRNKMATVNHEVASRHAQANLDHVKMSKAQELAGTAAWGNSVYNSAGEHYRQNKWISN